MLKTTKQKNSYKKGLPSTIFPVRKNGAGFTLLVAIVISSLLLSIGIAIFNITSKELRLSSLGRDSQFAFYAADSGIECALYWDKKGAVFATSSDSSVPSSGVMCANQDITGTWIVDNPLSDRADTTFNLTFFPETYCVTVVVSKVDSGGIITTTIKSRGYNTCDTLDPRRVERGIRTIYENS